MKTINFFTSHFIPENTAATNRVISFVKALEKKYSINLICLTEKGKPQENQQVKYSDHTTIFYVNQSDFDGSNFFIRAFNEIKYLTKLTKISKTLDCDYVIATTPYMFMIPIVGFGIPGTKIIDIRDLVWEYLDEDTMVKKWIKLFLTRIMKAGIKRFKHITVSNDYEYRLLTEKYNFYNISVISNGIDFDSYQSLIQINPVPVEQKTVTYVGNIGLAQNLIVLVKAAKRLPDVRFIIIGDGIETGRLKEYTRKHNIQNIRFPGKLTKDELVDYYKNSSVLYAQLDQKYVSAMPSKLYEYAAIGLPIIYGGVGQAFSFVSQLENAKAIEPNNVSKLVSSIKEITKRELTISKQNRVFIKKYFIREKSSQELLQIVDSL